MSKLLLVGPRKNIKNPSKTGGVIVLFEDLLNYCDKNDIKYEVIDTNKANYSNIVIAFLFILFFSIVKTLRVSHVSLHGTANDYIFIAPVIVFFSKLLKKKVSLRKFAGNFDIIYNDASYIKKRLIEYSLKTSDANFFETKYLIKKFKFKNKYTYWFPNVRNKTKYRVDEKYERKIIFLGSVSDEKGILELLEVSNMLDNRYIIDIYGTIDNSMKKVIWEDYNVNYKGILEHGNVRKVLSDYNILVLPSYREGYPGVIIEALSVGLPIIATGLEGIKEMIDEDSSVLIDIKNVKQLKEAIESFDDTSYVKKSIVALKQFENFDSDIQTDEFLKKIRIIC